ncbi:MAG: hypothetical protein J0L92_00845 [Deltaproteobacteria bacterium]|nr:hypothetical protein [Deltaproteobacteria bacterium]
MTKRTEQGARPLAVITGSKAMIDAFSHALGSQLEDAGMSVTRVVSDAATDLRVLILPAGQVSAYLDSHQAA